MDFQFIPFDHRIFSLESKVATLEKLCKELNKRVETLEEANRNREAWPTINTQDNPVDIL
jgi:uncharacterized coiled-coil protein SlyX